MHNFSNLNCPTLDNHSFISYIYLLSSKWTQIIAWVSDYNYEGRLKSSWTVRRCYAFLCITAAHSPRNFQAALVAPLQRP
jgi:hypothetical protein